jgi:hypothetical protein
MMEEEDAISWWEVRYITSPPFTATEMFIGETEAEVKKKFKQSLFGDKPIKTIIKIQ